VIHLVSVELESFRSFVNPTKIHFAERGLYCIKSINRDTGGSSGGGKSSIGLGLAYAFGACPIPSTELRSWGSKTPPTANLILDAATISRGKKVEVTVGGEKKDGSIAQKEAEFLKVFGGLDLEMIMALTYRGQRQPGLFLNKKDSEKKDFLTRVLALDKFEAALKESARKISALEQDLLAARLRASNFETNLKALAPDADANEVEALGQQLQSRMEERALLIAALVQEHDELRDGTEAEVKAAEESFVPALAEARGHVAALRAALQMSDPDDPAVVAAIENLRVTADQCAARAKKLSDEDNARRRDLEAKRSDYSKRIQALNLKAGATEGLSQEKNRIENTLRSMQVDVCPTCERDWDRAAAHRAHLTAELADVMAKIAVCEQILEQVEALIREVAKLPKFEPNAMALKLAEAGAKTRAQIATEEQKLKGARELRAAERRRAVAEADQAVTQIIASKAAASSDIRTRVSGRLQELQVEAEQLRREQQKDQSGLNELGVQLGRLRAQAEQSEKITVDLAVAQIEVASIEAQLKAEKDFAHLIGREGFLGSIFDEVLQEISDETNEVLGSIANTRHITLQFRSENVTQKGTIEREIRAFVTVRGHETTIRGGLSGGMLTTVELAVDLAVGAVISRRTGVCPGWLILDESFDGLDAVSKETCIEILQRYGQDRLVLVIDHASELQGMFTNVITVTYENGVSTIESSQAPGAAAA
jgi:hypothetical protein